MSANDHPWSEQLQTYTHISSAEGLSSITTLIVGGAAAAIIDPPFLIPDAESVVRWVLQTTNIPVRAVFVTHHHPDHYFSGGTILSAFPEAKYYAAPYVRAALDREYDDKTTYWSNKLGTHLVPEKPPRPESYPWSFFVLGGNLESPIVVLGPLQGDSIDHTLFWLPRERTIICGDAVYARSTHVWVGDASTPQIVQAWKSTLDVIESLKPQKVITGHLENGWSFNAAADLAHTRKYLQTFDQTISSVSTKPSVEKIVTTFRDAFPKAEKNLGFFLNHMANQFASDGHRWEENEHQNEKGRTKDQLEGFIVG
ncbi:putative metallo-beta-lactamase domain protein [Exophiala viscosa]|uniref:putative metallo-beta-lactamase domain protein n=1 Tax=Exophiala viscosa TaxID=2486360 RepID=UPI0021A22421|nr:putative metallo-beta-lactamase domain protein [Exophiala viscosa]